MTNESADLPARPGVPDANGSVARSREGESPGAAQSAGRNSAGSIVESARCGCVLRVQGQQDSVNASPECQRTVVTECAATDANGVWARRFRNFVLRESRDLAVARSVP